MCFCVVEKFSNFQNAKDTKNIYECYQKKNAGLLDFDPFENKAAQRKDCQIATSVIVKSVINFWIF